MCFHGILSENIFTALPSLVTLTGKANRYYANTHVTSPKNARGARGGSIIHIGNRLAMHMYVSMNVSCCCSSAPTQQPLPAVFRDQDFGCLCITFCYYCCVRFSWGSKQAKQLTKHCREIAERARQMLVRLTSKERSGGACVPANEYP